MKNDKPSAPSTATLGDGKRQLRRHDLVGMTDGNQPEQTAFSMSLTIRAPSMSRLQLIYVDIEQIVKKHEGVL